MRHTRLISYKTFLKNKDNYQINISNNYGGGRGGRGTCKIGPDGPHRPFLGTHGPSSGWWSISFVRYCPFHPINPTSRRHCFSTPLDPIALSLSLSAYLLCSALSPEVLLLFHWRTKVRAEQSLFLYSELHPRATTSLGMQHTWMHSRLADQLKIVFFPVWNWPRTSLVAVSCSDDEEECGDLRR